MRGSTWSADPGSGLLYDVSGDRLLDGHQVHAQHGTEMLGPVPELVVRA